MDLKAALQKQELEIKELQFLNQTMTDSYNQKIRKIIDEKSEAETALRGDLRKALSELDHLRCANATYKAQVATLTESYIQIFGGESSEPTD